MPNAINTPNPNNLPTIFNHETFGQLRIIADTQTGEPWFVAKDVCGALDLGYASAATKYLESDEQAVITNPSLTANPNGQLVIITEPGLYSLILRSRKPEARQFKRWITHEVLPSIRKHGGYLTPAKIEEALLDPDTLIRLATTLKEERALRIQAQTDLALAQPKAALVDNTFAHRARGMIKITEFARKFPRLNVSRIKADLMRLGYLYRLHCSAPYRIYSKYRDKYFVEKNNADRPGYADIYVLHAGAELINSLYDEGKLTMKRG